MCPSIQRRQSKFIALLSACLMNIGAAASAEPLVDPTQPYNARSASRVDGPHAAATLQLEAILHGSQRRLAIINGQLVHEGDRIANNLIESITPTSVRYSCQGQQHTLSLTSASLPEKQLSIRPANLTQLVKDGPP